MSQPVPVFEVFRLDYGDAQGGGSDHYSLVLATNDEAVARQRLAELKAANGNNSWTDYELKLRVER